MKRVVPLSGIVGIALVVLSFIIAGEPPDFDAPVDEVASFYAQNDSDQIGAAIVGSYGVLFFLFFATVLRNALRRAEPGGAGASTLAFGGAILFAAGTLASTGVLFALGDAADDIEPAAVQTLHILNVDVFALGAIGVLSFLLGSGIAVVKTGIFPAWLGWVAIVGGLFAMSPLWFVGMITFALFILISSVLLYRQSPEGASG